MIKTMPPSPFLSQILDASASGYAVLASELLLARRPEIAQRFAPHPRLAWKENLEGRLRDLSDALVHGQPGIFVDQVVWGKIAFSARGVPTDDLLESLVALREVLGEELPPDHRDEPITLIDQSIEAFRTAPTDEPSRLSAETKEGQLAARYVLALLEGDRRRASSILLDAVDSGSITVPDAYLSVLIPAQFELGRMWHTNEITVAEEHFVTSTTKMVMAQLLARSPVAPSNGRTVVASAVEGDAHDIGLHVASDFLEMAGWRVIFLGNNTPPNDLARAVEDFEADLLMLSATLPSQRRSVARTIGILRGQESIASVPVLVGGRAFTNGDTAWREVGADACAPANDAVSVADSLASRPRG